MWTLRKTSGGILWVEISTEDTDHYILPIFTSPDTAMDFLDDLEHHGEKVILNNINSTEQIVSLSNAIKTQRASAVILDPPNPDTMTSEEELVFWSGMDFCEIVDPIIEMSTTYGDERMIEVLNRYLNDKIGAA